MFEVFKQTHYTSISEIKFIGGNVLSYPYWDELVDELKKYFFKKSFFIDYRLLQFDPVKLEIFNNNDFFLTVLVDVSAIRERIENGKLPINQNFSYLFKISSIEEYEIAQSIIGQFQIEAKVIPFYDGTNLSFFETYIFQYLDDIVNTAWRKNDIFAHTILNTNHFGRFSILSNGKIYANVTSEPVGDMKSDNIKLLINQEMKLGNSWLLTRNKILPCRDCLYKYLCPSISHYETAIGKNNLCHVMQ